MKTQIRYEIVNERTWEDVIQSLPNPHFLQSTLWARIKIDNGWTPFNLIWKDGKKIIAGAMVLERNVKILRLFSTRILYCPKGPLLDWNQPELANFVLRDLENFAKRRKSIFLKIDPDLFVEGNEITQINPMVLPFSAGVENNLKNRGWLESKEQVQFRNSIYLSLNDKEEDLLSSMKQKTRYNIRLSERKGVTIRSGTDADFEKLYDLYAQTALRDNFIIRSQDYYLKVWKLFYDQNICEPLIAEFEGQILAAIIVYHYFNKSYYVYGMSSDQNRNLMATYLLQWKAIQSAKQKNVKIYDFWGAPDEFDESDRMWGVYKFKLGFGGIPVKTIGAWDFPVYPSAYKFYQIVLPKILDIMRKIGFRRLRTRVE